MEEREKYAIMYKESLEKYFKYFGEVPKEYWPDYSNQLFKFYDHNSYRVIPISQFFFIQNIFRYLILFTVFSSNFITLFLFTYGEKYYYYLIELIGVNNDQILDFKIILNSFLVILFISSISIFFIIRYRTSNIRKLFNNE